MRLSQQHLFYRTLLIILVLLVSLPGIAENILFYDFYQPLKPPRTLQVIAHRGLSSVAPENTIPAIQAAINAGFEWVEVDVRRSKDGAHIILHDENLNRKTNGSGPAVEKTLQEIKALDAGSWFAPRFAKTTILTLKEVLSFCKEKINIYLDCKDIEPAQLIREIQEAGMERQTAVTASPEILDKINQQSGFTIPVLPIVDKNLDAEYWGKRLHPAAVEIHANLITPDIVKRFHAAGILVQAQALNERDTANTWHACIEMGADRIETDYGENVVTAYTESLIRNNPPVKVSSHRGANEFAPENTLPAYRKAIDLGVDYIEIDVRTTKDKQIISLHDSRLDRTTDGKGPASEKTLAELNQLSAGSWFSHSFSAERIPTLEQICELVHSHPGPGGTVGLYVDMKDAEAEETIRILTQHGLTERNVFYGSEEKLLQIKRIMPSAKLMPSLGREDDREKVVDRIRPYAFDAKWNLLSKSFIEQARLRGVRIFSDAMGKPENLQAYLQAMEWGIDTIQTDRIPLVFRAMEIKVRSK